MSAHSVSLDLVPSFVCSGLGFTPPLADEEHKDLYGWSKTTFAISVKHPVMC
jgi:hypothetical protein